MKITGIDIGEYRQFRNIKFDFTYPEGHPKAGQPLEKVCFIGQSGTGKTTLLNVIWDFMYSAFGYAASSYHARGEIHRHSQLKFPTSIQQVILKISIDGHSLEFNRKSQPDRSDANFLQNWFESNIEWTNKRTTTNKLCLYIKDSISREADAILFNQKEASQNFTDFVKTDTQFDEEKTKLEEIVRQVDLSKVIQLGDMQLTTWRYLLKDVDNYDDETPKFMFLLGQKVQEDSSEVVSDLRDWLAKNPRIELSEKCLRPILDKFFLEVDFGAKPNVPIALRTKQDIKVPTNAVSTGTRQILATAIPIYKFDTKDTVILFDEPERSLFPDIQRELVKYYTGLAPEAQFFFATHSPIIAAAFEPCERFILYFDENGEVNYRNGVAPIGDDPNDILHADFGLNELMLDEGLEAYQKYRQLGALIRQETDEEKKNKLIAERLELGNRYNF